ncbi:uncharacterized protein LOC143102764 [Alosa pseudoharengus]|uniref:uncharacterized protein LOC143102764 n=1 Tax=Alosa pseudoharengus TaxID=34774 RepID=UPI003F8AFE03
MGRQDISVALRPNMGRQDISVALRPNMGRQDISVALRPNMGRQDISVALRPNMGRQDISVALRLCLGWCVCVCVCVCGAVDDVRVWPGQDVVVRCEAGSASGSYTQWLQVCPHQAPRFVQQSRKFSFKKSAVHGCYDLHVSGIASADVCLYFFALVEKDQNCDYMFQRTQTRLTLADSVPVVFDPSCPPVPEGGCSLPWTLLLIAGCLLSTLLALTWAHRICCNTGTGQREEEATGAEYQVDVCKYHQCEKTLRGLDCLHTEVTYRLIPMEAS